MGFLGDSAGKESACQRRRHETHISYASIPGLGRSCRKGNGNPLQYSCQDNPMGRGDWPATVHGVAKSWKGTSMHAQEENSSISFYRKNWEVGEMKGKEICFILYFI